MHRLVKMFNRFRTKSDVISAIIYKELSTRLGTSNILFGIIGVFIEPLGVILVLLAIRVLLRGRTNSEINIVLFTIAGVIPFYAFKDIAVRSLKSMKHNEPILIYKPVQPAGIIIARSIVECGIYGTLFIVLSLAVMVSSEKWMIDDLPLLLFSYFLLFITSLGVGLITIVLGHLYPLLDKIIPFLMRPLIFVSGVFFPLSSLPQNIRPILALNPILQSIDIARHAISNSYLLSDLISLDYLIMISMLTLSFGGMVSILSKKRLMRQ